MMMSLRERECRADSPPRTACRRGWRPAGAAFVLPLCLLLALVTAPAAHAFDPFEWEHVDSVEFVSILQNARTGEYMTTVAAGGPFETLGEARAAARGAIAEYRRTMAEAMAELERWRRAWDEYVASGDYARDLAEARAAWREAMAVYRVPGTPEYNRDTVSDRNGRGWRTDPRLRRYFDGFDANRDGVNDWGEIETFQQTVFETYRYQHNDRVLGPAEFMYYGGGDCDDFATFSAAFLEYHGYGFHVQ